MKFFIKHIKYLVYITVFLLAYEVLTFSTDSIINSAGDKELARMILVYLRIFLWLLTMIMYPLIFVNSYEEMIKYCLLSGMLYFIVLALHYYVANAAFGLTIYPLIDASAYIFIGLGMCILLMFGKRKIINKRDKHKNIVTEE